MTWCRDLSGATEHPPGETAEMHWASEQQTSNPSEKSAAAGSVRRAANVMTHVSVDAWGVFAASVAWAFTGLDLCGAFSWEE